MLDFYRFKHLDIYKNIFHAISTKSSTLPYDFSLALHTGEDTQSILRNRKQLTQSLENTHQKPLSFIVANQTHSSNIKVIQETRSQGWEHSENAIKNCDALITNLSNLVLTILTADCVPILLYDPKTETIAIIHAGWKGTKDHITMKTIKKMQEVFHAKPEDIVASIAPSIGQCCYEVGEDVAKHFFSYTQSYTQKEDKYMLDLPYLNKIQLKEAGLKYDNIILSNICTSCEVQRFFSYRKEKGCSGRFMSMIALSKNT